MDFPTKLLQLMEAAGLTEAALAEKSGVGRATVHAYLAGRQEPPLRNAIKLAQAMGVEVGVFTDCTFGNEPQVPTAPPARRMGRKMPAKPKRPPRGDAYH